MPTRSRPRKPDARTAPGHARLLREREQLAEMASDVTVTAAESAPVASRQSRLPPGQSLAKRPPVLDLGTRPLIDARDWRLEIGGLCATPATLALQDLSAFGRTDVLVDLHCVTGWSVFDHRLGGVPMARLLGQVFPKPAATHAILRSHDGYSTALPLADLMAPETLLVTHWAGAPLPREHGGPARLVVPHLYLWKSAKWLRSIRLIDSDHQGYWEARGYHRRGDPWREERYGR